MRIRFYYEFFCFGVTRSVALPNNNAQELSKLLSVLQGFLETPFYWEKL